VAGFFGFRLQILQFCLWLRMGMIREDNRVVVIVIHDERIEDLSDRISWIEGVKFAIARRGAFVLILSKNERS